MLVYYCPKCTIQNPQPQCGQCGRALGNTAVRYVWDDRRSTASDPGRLGLLARVSLGASLTTILVMFVMELASINGLSPAQFFTGSNIIPYALGLGIALFGLGLIALLMQGQESCQYMLDPKGVLKRTWIVPSRIRCWTRLIRYDQRAFQQNSEGKPYLLAHEEYLLWQDCARYKQRPRAGRILLYRPYAFLFMTLYLPRHEWDGALAMVAAKLKGKG